MNFGWLNDWKEEEKILRVVLHEFGHALGCIHEHQNPTAGIRWNVEAVFAYYQLHTDWDGAMVDANIFRTYDANSIQFTEFDPLSIMVYSIPRQFTLDGYEIRGSSVLSGMDK